MAGILEQLETRHAHVEKMERPENWPRLRAVGGRLNDPAVTKAYLVKAPTEKGSHFATRVKRTEFLGAVEGVVERFSAAVAGSDDRTTTYAADPEAPTPQEEHLAEWAMGDVDGLGNGLDAWMDETAADALLMGLCAGMVDVTQPRDAGAVVTNMAQAREQGVELRVTRFYAEQIRNWEAAERDSRLEWVVLRRTFKRQPSPMEKPEQVVEWLVVDRVRTQRYQATLADRHGLEITDQGILGVIDERHLRGRIPPKRVDVDENGADRAGVAHGMGSVPLSVMYGGKKLGPRRARSILERSARADIALLNEDSEATHARSKHRTPPFWIKSAKPLSQVAISPDIGFHLNPKDGEDIGYASAPADAFQVSLDAVERRRLEAYRQSGADPTGVFEGSGGASPESGRSRRMRFAVGEKRVLVFLAERQQTAHDQLLELAARRLLVTEGEDGPGLSLEPGQAAFLGSVRYPQDFETREVLDLADIYLSLRARLGRSPKWSLAMEQRLAAMTLGDADPELLEAVGLELEAAQRQDGRDENSRTNDPPGFGDPEDDPDEPQP